MDTVIVSNSPEETRATAAALAARLPPGSVIALHGDLGAGKTCFVKGLGDGLGVRDTITSPTYTLIHEYRGTMPLIHADLYRLADATAAAGAGLEAYLDEARGILAIEWPDRTAGLLPAATLHVTFELTDSPTQRRIRISEP